MDQSVITTIRVKLSGGSIKLHICSFFRIINTALLVIVIEMAFKLLQGFHYIGVGDKSFSQVFYTILLNIFSCILLNMFKYYCHLQPKKRNYLKQIQNFKVGMAAIFLGVFHLFGQLRSCYLLQLPNTCSDSTH